MQTKQLHVRLTEEELTALKGIAEQCEINATALAGFFMRAALRAVKDYGQRLKLPPNFAVVEEAISGGRFERLKRKAER
ncbi:MAG TPA: hypothetical protein VG167_14905 [Verrucomicrobiae bacterium]|nr:hypothetical protein [Verrucomicrobiae bacterium]